MGSFAIAIGAIAAAPMGCGSTNDTTPNVDASMTGQPESGPDAESDGADAGGSRPDTGATCVPIGVSVATVDAGPVWGCFQRTCALSLGVCAANCLCNNGIAGALACIGTGGQQAACFATALGGLGANPAAIGLLGCLTTAQACIQGDAGADGGGATDARAVSDVGNGGADGSDANATTGDGESADRVLDESQPPSEAGGAD
jgi:hypothetical protein